MTDAVCLVCIDCKQDREGSEGVHRYSHSCGKDLKESRYTCVSSLQCGTSIFYHSFAVFCFFAIARLSLSVISSDLPNSI